MFLIDRINLEEELSRQSSYLKRLEEKLENGRTDMLIELKVGCMEKIGKLNRKLCGIQELG